jgi:hypothetical protein
MDSLGKSFTWNCRFEVKGFLCFIFMCFGTIYYSYILNSIELEVTGQLELAV